MCGDRRATAVPPSTGCSPGDTVAADDTSPRSGASETLRSVTPADIDAIAAFYEKEMPQLVLFVATISRLDVHAAADIAQTAFERALPRWPGLQYPKAWLYRVARHEAIARGEAIRREMPAETIPDQPDPTSAAIAAELREEQRQVMACLQQLPPKQREVMTWTLAGFSDAEIAMAMGLTADAVKSNRRYARGSLRKRLGAQRRDAQ
jgi:RNA polymerase sigma factor (sigma-70 family)